MSYDSRSREDMRALALDIASIPSGARPAFVAGVVFAGLMLPPFWMRAAVWLGCKIHGDDRFDRWHKLMCRLPAVCSELVEQTTEHILTGKDRFSADSAGGLCEREVTVIEGLLAAIAKVPA